MSKTGIVRCLIGILLVKICASGFAKDFRQHPNWPTDVEHICGDTNDVRISGGQTAALGQFPWMARLIVNATLGGRTVSHLNCGGSLITDKHVVSAAHCVEEYKPFAVVLGEWDTSRDPDCSEDICAERKQTIPIEEYFFPSQYGELKQHDILLIKLARSIIFNGWIQPICLPTGLEQFPNYGEVAGWGRTGVHSRKNSKILKYVQLPFAPMEYCAGAGVGFPLDDRIQFCAGRLTKDDACVGDSGGPFMQIADTYDEPRYFLTGIVSMGPNGCGVGMGVYTRMTAYMDYILNLLK